jgi:hypothetical protein
VERKIFDLTINCIITSKMNINNRVNVFTVYKSRLEVRFLCLKNEEIEHHEEKSKSIDQKSKRRRSVVEKSKKNIKKPH